MLEAIQRESVVEPEMLEGCEPSPRLLEWHHGCGCPSLRSSSHLSGEGVMAETLPFAPMVEAWQPPLPGVDPESAFPPFCLGRKPQRPSPLGPSWAPCLMTNLT